ncbi:uncharacterized protein DUF1127 [Shimia isoporae]|uniref:Uncharacterized protein DUF1127 n=1 Tax=Shimia isoporae TaxID=647720 RepID=A0A4R1MZT7_9RHOB|nr:DUF1127 domain-containing protein [Shimia isoporae]TCK98867.1 uncharacterized protein DUF1127 [Shimia isoporae]
MALIETTSTQTPSFVQRLIALWRSNKDAYLVQMRLNATVRKLNSMTDRELADIGVSRFNIHDVARDAAMRG